MYKYLSMILAVLIVVSGGFFLYEKSSHARTNKKLNNEVAKLQSTIKETETVFSKLAVQINDIETENTELQTILDDRDESIVALSKVSLKWKDKYLKIANAEQSVVDENNNPVVIDVDCEDCFLGKRFRVDFEQMDGILYVKGFTLTNPAYAELKLERTKPLELEIALTKGKDGKWRVYVDGNNAGLEPSELNLIVDTSLFDPKWYEKIGLGVDIGVGPGVQTTIKAFYDVDISWFVGPFITFQYDGAGFNKFYGTTIGYYPFR